MGKNETLIIKGTEEAGKTYSFDNRHNPQIPAQWWFQNPPEGPTLFIVFYTQACRWAKCLGCNLPSVMSQKHIGYRDIFKQIDFIFNHLLDDQMKKKLKKIILSNNGSILDESTFSTTALFHFVGMMNYHCPNIGTLTLETRPEYVDMEELSLLARAIEEGDTPTTLELAIGFEAFDSQIRNDIFLKGLDLDKFENFAEKASKFAFRVKCYFMLKPVPGITNEEAVDDIKKAVSYLGSISRKYKLDINMHLNPTYAAKGTALEEAFAKGEFVPPELEDIREILLFSEDSPISIFVGLDDEGLAVPGGSFIREGDQEILSALELYNKTLDFSLLKK